MSYLDTYLGYGTPANDKILYLGWREGGNYPDGFYRNYSILPNPCPYHYCLQNPCGHNSCRMKNWEDFSTPFIDLAEHDNLERNISPSIGRHHLPFSVRTWIDLSIISMSAEGIISNLADRHTNITIRTTPNDYSLTNPIISISNHEAYYWHKMFQSHSNDCIAHITLPFLPKNLRRPRQNQIITELNNALNNYQWKAIVIYARSNVLRNYLLVNCGIDIYAFTYITGLPSILEGRFNGIPIFNFANVGSPEPPHPTHEQLFDLGQLIQNL